MSSIPSIRPNSLHITPPPLEHEYAEELDQFLHVFSDSDFTVSVIFVADAIVRFKLNLSRGIDGNHTAHIKIGSTVLLEQVALLL